MSKKNIDALRSIFFLFFLLIIIDQGMGIVLKNLYKNSTSGVAKQEYYTFRETHEDILVFGSSRAAFHYVPDVFEKILGTSVYNVGREGVGIYYHYAALISSLERYRPELIILDLDFRDIYDRGGNFGEEVFGELAPFYGKINNTFDSLIARNWYDSFFYQSNLFKYNKKVFNIVSGNLVKGRDNINGYRPLIGSTSSFSEKIEGELTISQDLIVTIENFIMTCQKNQIPLIISISPTFKEIPNEFYSNIEKISSKKNITVYDHSKEPSIINNKMLFYDSEHLNDSGARIFSTLLANRIQEEIF